MELAKERLQMKAGVTPALKVWDYFSVITSVIIYTLYSQAQFCNFSALNQESLTLPLDHQYNFVFQARFQVDTSNKRASKVGLK